MSRSAEIHAEALDFASSGERELGREAEIAFRAQGAFLRRIAHDIASPTGLTTTALEELVNGETPRPELVAMARRGLRRLLRLSEQLAFAAELASGDFVPDLLVEDIRDITGAALDQALAIDGRRDVVASLHVPDSAVRVDVDRRLLTSVMREVIGNALRLATSRVKIDVEREADSAILRVQDDGPGFADEALGNLSGGLRPTSSSRGLGLSLAVAAEVLTVHGAELRVETSTLPPGRRGRIGAAVVVVFPVSLRSGSGAPRH